MLDMMASPFQVYTPAPLADRGLLNLVLEGTLIVSDLGSSFIRLPHRGRTPAGTDKVVNDGRITKLVTGVM